MKKQSKRKTKSFKSSILLLLLMAVILSTSTFAWFTANQTVTVNSLQVKVEASNGLQISADGTNWKAALDNADLKAPTAYGAHTNQIPTSMVPVSTDGTVVDGNLNMFLGNITTNTAGTYIVTATQEEDTAGATGNYIVFDLFLKVDSPTTIYMTGNSKVEMVGDVDKGLQNAARVGFVKEGNTSAGSALKTIQELSLDSGTASIWEPNYDTHTAAGVANALDTYGQTVTTTGNANPVPYYGVKAAIPSSADITMQQKTTPNSTYFSAVTPAYKTKSGNTASVSFMALDAGITKIRTYMWVEGQDVDCENNASGTDISYTLQFSTQE